LPESKAFLDTYLREIGVHTPISLLTSMGSDSIDLAGNQHRSTTQNLKSIESDPIEMIEIGLDQLSQDAATCRLCTLADTRTKVVFGVGNSQADLLLIGEAPGQDEDNAGEPFVGTDGQLLDRMLHAMGLDRKVVYIINAIKCRPPNSRDPRPDEVQACHLWFEQQLNILQPKMICLLGRVAAQTLLQTDATLGALRGRWHDYQGIPVWVTYHPAYLLRSPRQKQKSWQDLMQLSRRFQALKAAD